MRTGAHIRRFLVVVIITAIHALATSDPAEGRGRDAEELTLDYDRVLRDPRLMTEFAEMFLISESTPRQIEIAAFLVRKPGNRFSIVRWPTNGRTRTETWHGPIPRGTIAVVHTHPNGWMKPSAADHEEAERIGLPFIILTRSHIYVAEPERRHAVALLRGVDWSDDRYLLALETNDTGPRRQILVATTSPAGEETVRESPAIRPAAPMP